MLIGYSNEKNYYFMPYYFYITLHSQVRKLELILKIISTDNQLIGYGVVVGLRGTGDSRSAALTTMQ